jgi:putative oxidoreductase
LQRLFSTFANGWPGKGLLLQRLITGAALLVSAIELLLKDASPLSAAPQLMAALAGIFLALGLWTPVSGTLVAAAELWIAVERLDNPFVAVLLATFGVTLAMIGPGAWSVDARLFGRKRLETPHDSYL